jgi:hypothetical protein
MRRAEQPFVPELLAKNCADFTQVDETMMVRCQ